MKINLQSAKHQKIVITDHVKGANCIEFDWVWDGGLAWHISPKMSE